MMLSPDISPRKPVIPRTVWALGFVSLFMDISSEIVHALLPLFLTSTLGLSVALVGLVDGIAESTASIAKIFSGYVSDRLRRRKPLILLGYGLAALSKPLFPLAEGLAMVLSARFADRIGKGIRGAPRDALIADVTPQAIRGRAYGLRQALDTVGAFVGPLLAVGLMYLLASDMRAVFWIAVIPAGLAVLLVLFGVKDQVGHDAEHAARIPIQFKDVTRFGKEFQTVLVIGTVFTLARFSEAFLILKASADGLPFALAPLVLVAMNIVYALGAYPAGTLSDHFSSSRLLIFGAVTLIAADLVLAFSSSLYGTFFGIALWGLHMAVTQGLFAKLVAHHSPQALRASAFGIFNLATGLALLFASIIAGVLWDYAGPAATFLIGASFATLAALMCLRRSGSID
ncbi:MAG: MFS transporter [Gammaproteobacteria bacterium]|nr:MFS transporter [Gammaproteobacteria bacterium]MDH5239896.1 MFS transporter [Gammaproteobacteria bacterium]